MKSGTLLSLWFFITWLCWPDLLCVLSQNKFKREERANSWRVDKAFSKGLRHHNYSLPSLDLPFLFILALYLISGNVNPIQWYCYPIMYLSLSLNKNQRQCCLHPTCCFWGIMAFLWMAIKEPPLLMVCVSWLFRGTAEIGSQVFFEASGKDSGASEPEKEEAQSAQWEEDQKTYEEG